MQKRERMRIFFERLKAAEPATSRDDALALMKRIMDQVEDEFSGLPWSNFGQRMHIYGFEPLYNWQNLEGNPCWWDDAQSRVHRTELYNDGRIVIKRLSGTSELMLDKPGKAQYVDGYPNALAALMRVAAIEWRKLLQRVLDAAKR